MVTSSASPVQRAFYFLATLIMITALLYWGREVLVPMALAMLLTFVLSVPQRWLEQRGVRRWASVLLVAVAALAVMSGLVWLVAGEFRSLAAELPKYEETVRQKLAPLRLLAEQAEKLEMLPPPAEDKDGARKAAASEPRQVVLAEPHSRIVAGLQAVAGPLLDVGAKTILVVVLIVYMLARRESLIDRVLRLVGPRHLARTTKAMDDAGHRVSRYLLLQTFTNTCVGAGAALGLLLIGVPYAPLWGVLALVLRYVPYVGIWMAAALPLALSIAIFPDWTQPALVVAVYIGLEMVMFNVIEPLVFGHGTGVMPVALLLAAAFWAWLWGLVGLLLSTPLTVCLVVLGRHVPSLGWLDILLAETAALSPANRFYQRLVGGDQVQAAQVLQDYLRSHPALTVYDEVLVPALLRVRQDREEQQLSAREERAILRRFHELLTQLGPGRAACSGAVVRPAGSADVRTAPTTVIASPAHAVIDELAIEMLRLAVRGEAVELEVVPPQKAAEAAHLQPEPGQRVTFLLTALTSGLAPCENYCKRVRAAHPEARILVARLRKDEDADMEARRVRLAGADEVTDTLLATRTQLVSPPQPRALPVPSGRTT